MGYPIEIKENHAAASANYSRVSRKKSTIVAKRLRGMKLADARSFLEGMVSGTKSMGGKHYTKTAMSMLELLNSVERNAKQRELGDNLKIKTITAEQGPKRYRRKSLGGRQKGTLVRMMKICHLKAVVEDLDYGMKKSKAKNESKPAPSEKKSDASEKEAKTPAADKKDEAKKEAPVKAEKKAAPEEKKEESK